MNTDQPHDVWQPYLAAKGLASLRDVAARTAKVDPERKGIAHETVRNIMYSDKRPSGRSVQLLADALGIDAEMVHELRGSTPPLDQWEPPESSRLLNADERDVLARLIATMTRGRTDEGATIHHLPRYTDANLSDPIPSVDPSADSAAADDRGHFDELDPSESGDEGGA